MSGLTFDQRHYFAYCAMLSAGGVLRRLRSADAERLDGKPFGSPQEFVEFGNAAVTSARATEEWRGIERACRREVARITRQRDAARRIDGPELLP